MSCRAPAVLRSTLGRSGATRQGPRGPLGCALLLRRCRARRRDRRNPGGRAGAICPARGARWWAHDVGRARDVSVHARLRPDTGTLGWLRRDVAGVRSAAVRRAAAPCAPAALRPAVRDGRRPGQLGGAAGSDAGPAGPPDGGARRGPPARVRRLRGRDPVGPVRRRRRDRLGSRHVGAVQGGRPDGRRRGRGAARRAARVAVAREVRAGAPRRGRPARQGAVAAAAQARRARRRGLGRRGPSDVGRERADQRRGEGRPRPAVALGPAGRGGLRRAARHGRPDAGRARRARRPGPGRDVGGLRSTSAADQPRQGAVPGRSGGAAGHQTRARALRRPDRTGHAAVPAGTPVEHAPVPGGRGPPGLLAQAGPRPTHPTGCRGGTTRRRTRGRRPPTSWSTSPPRWSGWRTSVRSSGTPGRR